MDLQDKIKEAERALRLAAEMSEYYYHKPLVVCYSGGKDSDVMLDIAKRCLSLNQFEVVNSHTTVDAPETVYHIRAVFKDLESQGIKTTVKMPTYKGKPISMWRLIEIKTMPPTRFTRYCCSVLKETTMPNRMIAIGVREDESLARQGKDIFNTWHRNPDKSLHKTTGHTYAMFKLDQTGNDEAYECEYIKACKAHKKTIINPIYRFTEAEVWQYIKTYDLTVNPLYAKGYKRVGCIGCPLGSPQSMTKEFLDNPKYKENYIKAFDRMIANSRKRGTRVFLGDDTTGEDVMRWWLGENPKQVRIDDILSEVTNDEQE